MARKPTASPRANALRAIYFVRTGIAEKRLPAFLVVLLELADILHHHPELDAEARHLLDALPAPLESAPRASRKPGREASKEATPRSRMKGLTIELPDYAWVALKKRAAEDMVSLRHVIMTALRAKGIPINDADMVEDGRRLRG